MFGEFGSPEGMAEAAVASGAMSEAEAYGGFDTPEAAAIDGGGGNITAYGGNHGIVDSMKDSLTKAQTTAVPVDNSFWATAQNALRTAVTPSYVHMLAAMIGNPPRMGYNKPDLIGKLNHMNIDPDTYNWDLLAPSVPHNPHDRVMVEMTGTDVSRAPAIGQTAGGINYGPGWPMDENFYPGYGTNPFTGAAMADPSDPYIRKQRGTEIAGMVGP